jgi:hypothetical protein
MQIIETWSDCSFSSFLQNKFFLLFLVEIASLSPSMKFTNGPGWPLL